MTQRQAGRQAGRRRRFQAQSGIQTFLNVPDSFVFFTANSFLFFLCQFAWANGNRTDGLAYFVSEKEQTAAPCAQPWLLIMHKHFLNNTYSSIFYFFPFGRIFFFLCLLIRMQILYERQKIKKYKKEAKVQLLQGK